jgi:hypothetical protein
MYMNNHAGQILACFVLVLSYSASSGEEAVVEFRGTGNQTTAEFKVKAPWVLDWRLNSDYSKMISFDLDLVNGDTGVLIGNIKSVKSLGNGVRLFNEGGNYRFRVHGSFIRWHLKVRQLTRAEAERYTPRNPP